MIRPFMPKISKQELEEITRSVEEEFPDDPAMQQVHIAREILALEAEKAGMSYIDYIRSLRGRTGEQA
jgi:hypothetical protein